MRHNPSAGNGAVVQTMQQTLDFQSSPVPESTAPVTDLSEFLRVGPAGLDPVLGVLDAYRVKISHAYDKLSSLSNSRTRLLPHQIEATHRVSRALKPRFILADEVGLGKTIEAGLIIKELCLRRGFKRVLVVAPATLVYQWQAEMRTKFNEHFDILNRQNFHRVAANWAAHPRILTSVDFIKNPRYSAEVLKRRWDVVVFDEAHRLRRDYSKVTQAYAFADAIAEKSNAMLLLSATPFRGKLEELYYLVRLVDPYLLGPYSSFTQEYLIADKNTVALGTLKNKLSNILIRRRKVEVGGFTKRFARTIRFELGVEERLLYDEMTDYVKREYNRAMVDKNRAVGFIMIVFQKLLDSSTRALLRALEKRKTMLEQRLFGPVHPAGSIDEAIMNDRLEELLEDDEPEEHFPDDEDPRARSMRETRKELLTLNRLISIARSIRQDRKLSKMRETLHLLKREGHIKFVIFTQFRTTQDYIGDALSDEFSVTLFHGSLNAKQKEDAILEFRDKTEILICTEAGGEGRNLQFASILFNYDLPWSPLKIEQRIGRIHRFGQKVDVKIFNFSTADTVAERVLEVLEQKIRLFEESIGPSDALLGAVENELDFESSLMSFVAGRKTKKELNAEIESQMRIAESAFGKLNELVTPQCVDFNLKDYYDHTRENRAIANHELETITLTYLTLNEDPNYQLRAIPTRKTKEPAPEYELIESGRKERPATFNSNVALVRDEADFLAVGHPLVDRALEFFLTHPNRKAMASLPANVDPTGRLRPGYYFVCLCRYLNGISRAELISCMVPTRGNIEIPEDILIPAGLRAAKISEVENKRLARETSEPAGVREAVQVAMDQLKLEAETRALALREKLHSIFKKEEYSIEINYGKKIRQLSEKLDRQRFRNRQNGTTATQAAVTRTENELARARRDKEMEILRIRKDSRVQIELELLQIYRIV